MDKVREALRRLNELCKQCRCMGGTGWHEYTEYARTVIEPLLAQPSLGPSECTCEYPDFRRCPIHSPVTTFSAQQLIDEWRKVNLDPKLTSTSLFSEDWFAAYADRLNSLVRAVPAFSEEQVRSCWRGDRDGYPDFPAMTAALNALLGAAPPASSVKPVWKNEEFQDRVNAAVDETQESALASQPLPLPSPLPMPTIQARPVNEFPTGFPVHEVPSALVRGLPYKIKR